MPTPSFVQLPADSTGKKLRTTQVVVGTDTVQQQGVTLYDPDGNPIAVKNTDPLETDYGLVVRTIRREPASFYAVFDRIVPAANKYMATIFNTSSTRKVVIQRIWLLNWQVAAVTGVLLEQYLAFITARTLGTAVTARAYDSQDTLNASITLDTNSTVVTERDILERFFASNEEVTLTSTGLTGSLGSDTTYQLVYDHKDGMRGLTLRANQGLSIRNVTASTVGSVSYIFEFTEEVA